MHWAPPYPCFVSRHGKLEQVPVIGGILHLFFIRRKSEVDGGLFTSIVHQHYHISISLASRGAAAEVVHQHSSRSYGVSEGV